MSTVASIVAAPGGARLPVNHPQDFDYFLVVDFEATCEKDKRIYPQEIIEFPSVLVNGATGRIESAFRRYVRPKYHPVLTQFCRDLTGIRQEDVDGGVDLGDALLQHHAWLKAATGARQPIRLAVVTWGDWDCRTMLEFECCFKGIAKPAYFDRWINLRVPFEEALGGGGRTKLQEAVQAAGLEWEGRLHCGLDDARNTARLLVELMWRGAKIEITGSLASPPLPIQKQEQEQHELHISPRGFTASPAPPQIHQQKPHMNPCGGAPGAGFWYSGVASRGGLEAAPWSMQGNYFLPWGNWTPAMGAVCPSFVWST